MKVCLSTSCEPSYLKQADEIKFKYKDRKGIGRFHKSYPNATIILEHHILHDEEIDWKFIKDEEILSNSKIVLCLNNIKEAEEARKNGINFYLNYPITSFYDLEGVIRLQPIYIKIGAPLFFMLDKVKNFTNIPIRHTANVAYEDGLPRSNGVNGTWIRPDDLKFYEKYIETIEFEDCDQKKEQALFRIYKLEQGWSGELQELITNFNYLGTNRMVPPEVTKHRLNCGQRCAGNGSCHICYRGFDLANPDKLKEYLKNKE